MLIRDLKLKLQQLVFDLHRSCLANVSLVKPTASMTMVKSDPVTFHVSNYAQCVN